MPAPEFDLLDETPPGPRLAVTAEVLFLVNLMLAPGVAFLILVVLWRRHRNDTHPLVRNHLRQTVAASLWGGSLLVGVTVAVVLLGGFTNPWSWVVSLIYFVCFHAALILFGVIGLSRAMASRPYRYPVIGPKLVD